MGFPYTIWPSKTSRAEVTSRATILNKHTNYGGIPPFSPQICFSSSVSIFTNFSFIFFNKWLQYPNGQWAEKTLLKCMSHQEIICTRSKVHISSVQLNGTVCVTNVTLTKTQTLSISQESSHTLLPCLHNHCSDFYHCLLKLHTLETWAWILWDQHLLLSILFLKVSHVAVCINSSFWMYIWVVSDSWLLWIMLTFDFWSLFSVRLSGHKMQTVTKTLHLK